MKEQADLNVRYIDPTTRDYREYFDHLIAYNEALQERISRDLSKRFGRFLDNSCDNFCITTVGSDARQEKGPKSLVEMVLFIENFSECNRVIRSVKRYVSHKDRISIFDKDIEIKDVGKERMSECHISRGAEGEFTITSPFRVFDARLLFGNEDTYTKAKEVFAEELMSPYGKSVLDKVKDKVKEQQRIMLSGSQRYKGETITHYDFERGVASYNPAKGILSFKQGPLRVVQFAIVRDLIQALRNGVKSGGLLYLPYNTVAKLNFLEVNGHTGLSSQDLADVCDYYKFFLWFYHRSQQRFYEEGTSEVEFDKKEVKERIDSLDAILRESKLVAY